MYCIECGIQIPESSKFCPNCGHNQLKNETVIKEKIVKENQRELIENHKSSIDYQFLKKSMTYYLTWILIHLGLLLIGSGGIFNDGYMGARYFWPFGKGYYYNELEIKHYDITEFLIYSIFPLGILIIWSMARTKTNIENTRKKL